MDVQEIEPGLWRWTAWHEEWREQVGCVYVERGAEIALIDPLVPPEDAERFHRALDRDAARAERVHVLLTVFWHGRSARELAARHRARVRAPSRARAAAERRAGPVEPFRPGDPLPLGIEAFPTARSSEVVYWLPERRTLVAGDVILGGPRLCPESWLPAGVGHAELRASLRPLLDLDVERILVSHGEPVLAGGRDALAALL